MTIKTLTMCYQTDIHCINCQRKIRTQKKVFCKFYNRYLEGKLSFFLNKESKFFYNSFACRAYSLLGNIKVCRLNSYTEHYKQLCDTCYFLIFDAKTEDFNEEPLEEYQEFSLYHQ